MPKRPIKHLRWYIAILLCLASELNYMDRSALAALKGTIQADFGFSDSDYAMIGAIFLWVYAFSYLATGWLVDRIGSRRSMILFVSGWSLANMLHSMATGVKSLAFFRGLLATMEPGSFPAGIKAVSEWFPMKERAMAVGIFSAGVALGSTLAMPIVTAVTLAFNWQAAFLVTGGVGFIWVAVWYFFYQLPEDHPRISGDERAMILAARDVESVEVTSQPSLARLVRMREAWGCILARVLTDPISYFITLWFPAYLQKERGFTLQDVGRYGWIPYLGLTLGYLFGGALPRRLIARGWSLSKARKTTMLGVSLAMFAIALAVPRVSSPMVAVALLSLFTFGHAAWSNITLPTEVFHKSAVGTVTGLGGFLGAITGGAFQLVVGSVVTKYGYTPIFSAFSVAYLTALLAVHLCIGELGIIRHVPSRAAPRDG